VNAARVELDHAEHVNRLLAMLPVEERARISRRSELVTLGHDVLQRADVDIRYVYFPTRGLFSVMAELEDGKALEVATIGPEGMAGIALFLGTTTAHHAVVSQLAGESLMLTAAAFAEEVDSSRTLRDILARYSAAYIALLSQTAACNGAHQVRQRLARLLLTCNDGSRADRFAITQEFLAGMLGVQRPGVSLIAEALQREGLIAYRRGNVQVLDRQGLERASCECYASVRMEFDRLLH
jgi:CRP-like cAMP-binding protein